MSDITEIIDTLERRIKMLVEKTGRLEQEVARLHQELKASDAVRERQQGEIASLQSACDTLKMANALLGSDDNKRETKLKINSLIREIDYCISQLAD